MPRLFLYFLLFSTPLLRIIRSTIKNYIERDLHGYLSHRKPRLPLSPVCDAQKPGLPAPRHAHAGLCPPPLSHNGRPHRSGALCGRVRPHPGSRGRRSPPAAPGSHHRPLPHGDVRPHFCRLSAPPGAGAGTLSGPGPGGESPPGQLVGTAFGGILLCGGQPRGQGDGEI